MALSVEAVGSPTAANKRLAAARMDRSKFKNPNAGQPTRPAGMRPALDVAQTLGQRQVGQLPTGARPMAQQYGTASQYGGGQQMVGQSPTGPRPPAPNMGSGGWGNQQPSWGNMQGGYGGQQTGGQYPGSTNWWQQSAQAPQSQMNYGSSQFNYGGGYAPSGYSAQGPYNQQGQGYGAQGMPSYQAPSFQNTAYPQLAQTNYQRQLSNYMPNSVASQYNFGNAVQGLGINPATQFQGYGTAWGPTQPGQWATGSGLNWSALNQQGQQSRPPVFGGGYQPGRKAIMTAGGNIIGWR